MVNLGHEHKSIVGTRDLLIDTANVFVLNQVSNNGFKMEPLSTLRGSIQAGADGTFLKTGQTGWLDRPRVDAASLLRVTAGEEGARLVFYAGQPQGDSIVSYGPFMGDSKQDIVRLYTEFQSGQFVSLSELVKAAV